MNVHVTNTGPNTQPATIAFDRAGYRLTSSGPVTCTTRRDGITCRTPPLAPGESLHLKTWIYGGFLHWNVRVTATLGTAEASKRVEFGCSGLPLCPLSETAKPTN